MKNTPIICLAILFAGSALPSPRNCCLAQDISEASAQVSPHPQQEKAARVARELLTRVVRVQMRQMEDNQLEETQTYRDIVELDQHLDELALNEFQEIGTLIATARIAPTSRSEQAWSAVRERVRQVVLELVVERQTVLQRMQAGHWVNDANRLIESQMAAMRHAEVEADAPADARETQLVEAIESQRFVLQLFHQFDAALAESITWGDRNSQIADVARRLIRASGLADDLKNAEDRLTAGDRETARIAQDAALRTLRRLPSMLQPIAGRADPSLTRALQLVEAIQRRQNELNQQTDAALNDTTASTTDLVEAQQAVHSQLGEVIEHIDSWPELLELAEQTRAASFRATDKLFQRDREALTEQAQLASLLAELQSAVAREMDRQSSDRSADELADEVESLTRQLETLRSAAAAQHNASDVLETNRDEASRQQVEVGRIMEPLSGEFRFEAARRSVAHAIESFSQPTTVGSPTSDEDRQIQLSVARADADLANTVAETAADLADLRRRHKAIEVGELARAAEALERAAAAEGRLARQLAGENRPPSPGDVNRRKVDHQEAAETSRRIALGVRRTAPEASQVLADLGVGFEQVDKALQAASAVEGKSQGAEAARQLQESLANAAAQIRAQGARSADALAQLASEQLEPLTKARTALQQADLASTSAALESAEQARQALDSVQSARQSNLRAAGGSQAADMHRAVVQLNDASQRNAYAALLSGDLAEGQAETPWSVANEQEKVTEKLRALADDAKGELREMLQQAAADSAEAARADLEGDSKTAERARAGVQAGLERARNKAETLRDAALAGLADQKAPPQSQEAARQLAQALETANRLTTDALPESKALSQARRLAEELTSFEADAQTEQAAEHRRRIDQLLATAEEQLTAESIARTEKLAAEVNQQVEAAQGLAESSAKVDPQAAMALRRVAESEVGSHAAQNSKIVQQSAQRVAAGGQRAMASLSMREDHVRRDAQIASRMAQLMRDQQTTRDDIAEQAAILEAPLDDDDAPSEAADVRQQAAESLQNAMRDFADMQVETGEGAVAISQQEEVANEDLLAGLRAASRLSQSSDSAQDGDESGGKMSSDEATAEADAASPDGEKPSEEAAGPGEMRPPSEDADPSEAKAAADESQLGEKFVPSSPDATARQIAGEQAASAASAMRGEGGQQENSAQQGEPSPGDNPGALAAGQQQRTNLSSGAASQGLALQDDPMETDFTGASTGEAPIDGGAAQGRGKQFAQPAWFAKLPPSIQEAIRASSRRAAPRGYELRLRRYFQSNE